jgi:ribosomal protein L40E
VYGDHASKNSIPTKSFHLTNDHEEILKSIHSLPRISGGLDYSEAVVDGLKEGIDMAWRNGAHRVIILIGDAPPHGYTSNPCDMVYIRRWNAYYPSDCFPHGCPCGYDPFQEAKRARENGIIIYSVGVNARPDVKESFQKISKISGGEYLSLNDAVKLPELILNLLINEVKKMETDIRTYAIVQRTKVYSPEYLSSALGLSKEETTGSLDRLKKKGYILSKEYSEVSKSIKCDRCGVINFSSANFCRHCGKTLRSK